MISLYLIFGEHITKTTGDMMVNQS